MYTVLMIIRTHNEKISDIHQTKSSRKNMRNTNTNEFKTTYVLNTQYSFQTNVYVHEFYGFLHFSKIEGLSHVWKSMN